MYAALLNLRTRLRSMDPSGSRDGLAAALKPKTDAEPPKFPPLLDGYYAKPGRGHYDLIGSYRAGHPCAGAFAGVALSGSSGDRNSVSGLRTDPGGDCLVTGQLVYFTLITCIRTDPSRRSVSDYLLEFIASAL
jgi:hypothetical protein